MPVDDPIETLVEGVLGEVRGRVERDARSLVARLREQAEVQKQTALQAVRAEAEAHARAMIAAAQAEAARQTEDAVARSKEDVARARAEADRAVAEARAEAARLVETAVAEAQTRARQTELAGAERLLEAVRSIDHAQSLSEVLHLLADTAAEIAPRVALFVVQGDRLRSWRIIGFAGELATTGFETGLDGDELLGAAALTGQAVTTSTTDRRTLPSFASLKGGRAGIALPLEVGGETVAVLYADDDADDPARAVPSAWPEVAELLTRHAARCLQALTGSRIAEALSQSEV